MYNCLLSDKSQSLSYDELFQACKRSGINLSPHEAAQLVAMIDKDGSGEVSTAEFMKYFFFFIFFSKIGIVTDIIILFNSLIFKRYFGVEADTGGVSNKLLQVQRPISELKSRPTTENRPRSCIVLTPAMPSVPSLVVETDPHMSSVSSLVETDLDMFSKPKSCTKESSLRMPEPRSAHHLHSQIGASLPKLEREMKKFEFDRIGMKQNEMRKVCNIVGLSMSVNEAEMLWATFGKTSGSKIKQSEFCAHFKRLRPISKNDTLRPISEPENQISMTPRPPSSVTSRPPTRQQMSSRQHRLRMQMQSQNN
jgi:Ca2+-binding EF-hand superfamily protein